jgi:hypothetical protein
MIGNISKMKVALAEPVEYSLPVDDEYLALNETIGGRIHIDYQGEINCVSCGRKTSKSYAQGHCYPCFMSLAECDMCILKPETCHFAAGTCRQPDWGQAHCMQPHYVYLANSSGIKVGITRGSQIPTRWIDQGASQALPIFRVGSRYQSGLLEVAIKQHVADRTDWRKMLRGDPETVDLAGLRDELTTRCEAEITRLKQDFGDDNIEFLPAEPVVDIHYPVVEYPQKVRSFNLLKQPQIEGALLGIKGQYLILDTGVFNVRNHAGYKIDVHLN